MNALLTMQKIQTAPQFLVAGSSPLSRTLAFLVGSEPLSDYLASQAESSSRLGDATLLIPVKDETALKERAYAYQVKRQMPQICLTESDLGSLGKLLPKIADGPQSEECILSEIFSKRIYEIAHDLRPLWMKPKKPPSVFEVRKRLSQATSCETEKPPKRKALECLEKVAYNIKALNENTGSKLEEILFKNSLDPFIKSTENWFKHCDEDSHAEKLYAQFSEWQTRTNRKSAMDHFKYLIDQQGKIQIAQLLNHLAPNRTEISYE